MPADRAWYTPGAPPPLPPRSPRPAEPMSYSPAYHPQYGLLPPPPPGPPPRSPGLAPVRSDVPPPIPPRPPGFEGPVGNVHSYSVPSPAATPQSGHNTHSLSPSGPVMSANLPWISHQPDNVQPYAQPGASSSHQSDGQPEYRPPTHPSATPRPQSAMAPIWPSHGPPQTPQSDTVMPGVTDSFSRLNVIEATPNAHSHGQYQVHGNISPPPAPPHQGHDTASIPASIMSPSLVPGADLSQAHVHPPPPPKIALTPTHSEASVANPHITVVSPHTSPIPCTEPLPPPPPVVTQNVYESQPHVSYDPRTFPIQPQESHIQPSPAIYTSPTPLQSSATSLDSRVQTSAPPNSIPLPNPASSQPESSLRGDQAKAGIGSSTTFRPGHRGGNGGGSPEALSVCLDGPTTFATTWYTHPSAPEYFICSRCYVDHIYPSRFRDAFSGSRLDDKQLRLCRFSKPRMSRHMFPAAVSNGSLHEVLDWMKRRSAIVECKGAQGAKASEDIKWFTTRNGDIQGFLACEACYEDYCLVNSFASQLKPMTEVQKEDDVWSCDVAIPFIRRAYEEFGKSHAWTTFSEEAAIRLHQVPACPGQKDVSTNGRKWYQPKNNDPKGLVICTACYCDNVLLTKDKDNWSEAPGLSDRLDMKATCDLSQWNIHMPMLASQDHEDPSIFWKAVREVVKHPRCEGEGTANAVWYTFPSHPANFGICGACHAGILGALGVDKFFVRKRDVPPDAKLLCCMHPAHPRRNGMTQRLVEVYWSHKPEGFERYAIDYAATPACRRDEDFKNGVWYGWDECTICPECYLEFVKGTKLARTMPLQGTARSDNCMCEMYSPRMRRLYLEACKKNDTSELLQFSLHRRSVYVETIPECRMLVQQGKLNLQRQRMQNMLGSFYTNLGATQEITMPSAYTYSSPGLGGGFHNQNEITGAAYSKQGWNTFTNSQSFNLNAGYRIKQLEPRWRAVE